MQYENGRDLFEIFSIRAIFISAARKNYPAKGWVENSRHDPGVHIHQLEYFLKMKPTDDAMIPGNKLRIA